MKLKPMQLTTKRGVVVTVGSAESALVWVTIYDVDHNYHSFGYNGEDLLDLLFERSKTECVVELGYDFAEVESFLRSVLP